MTPSSEAALSSSPTSRKAFISVATVALIWAGFTYLFWLGYAGADDMFYARYAFLFHRPPMNWWEFRIPEILALRVFFLAFGPSEFAAALPSLLSCLAMLVSAAWLLDWPRRLTWQTQSAMILFATLPLDVGFRSTPSATNLAAAFLVSGTVCWLKGTRTTQYLGAALFAAGFTTHETSFFYIAIFCCICLLFDYTRFWRPVLVCVVLAGSFVILEGVVYKALLGDFFARFKTSASATSTQSIYETDWTLSKLRFFTWPLENFVLGKPFGFDLILLFGTGLAAWKKLLPNQKILYTATFAAWAWFGYGTIVPWSYQPLYRQFHYYGPLVLGVATLLPFTVGSLLEHRKNYAVAVMSLVLTVHMLCLAAGGHYGSDVDVSRALLSYAQTHPGQVFVTDVATMNHMYTVNGFVMPANVVCLNGPSERHLLVNKEPSGTPFFQFPERQINGILVNRDELELGVEPEFTDYLKQHGRLRTPIVSKRVKLLFRPLVPLIGEHSFMIRTQGGELVTVI